MSRTLQIFLLEIALLNLACLAGIFLVAVGWLVGWLGWLVWQLFYVAMMGKPTESYEVDAWADRAR